MKHYLFILSLLVAGAATAQPKKVILISIDGFRADFYRDKSLSAPNLQRLAAEGVQATGAQSVFPSLTYPAHTSLTTGAALPIHHGIYFNNVFEGKEGQGIWEDSLIKVETIWKALHKANLVSAAVMWPVTVGAPIDYNFPVRRADEDEQSDQITMTRPYVTPKGWLDEYEKVNGPLSAAAFNDKSHRQDSAVEKMAMYMFKTYQPALTAFHLLSMDHVQHADGRDAASVKESLRIVDGLIGLVFKQLKEWGMEKNTTVIITGDHGFVNSELAFSPNVLLAQHGLLQGKQWKAKFNAAGGSSFLYVKNNDAQVLQQVVDLLKALPEEQRKLFRIVDRKQMDSIGANGDAMMAIAMLGNARANNKANGELVQYGIKGGHHGNFPDFAQIQTGFIAVGAGVQSHKVISNIGVKDVSPLIAALLGVPFKAPDGVVVDGILAK